MPLLFRELGILVPLNVLEYSCPSLRKCFRIHAAAFERKLRLPRNVAFLVTAATPNKRQGSESIYLPPDNAFTSARHTQSNLTLTPGAI